MFVYLSVHNKTIAKVFLFLFYLEFILTPTKIIANVPQSRFHFDILTPDSGQAAKAIKSTEHQPSLSVDSSENGLTGKDNPDTREANKLSRKFTTGPTQPEMSTFQSVNANNMVDLFTGDFSYNIPLLDVGGYPVNIHYQSGITMDQDASWVGLGWNINPGAVTRNMRGLPDDFAGTDLVTKTMSMKENKTIGVNLSGNLEYTGIPMSLGAGIGVFHNSYKGWGTETSLNAGITSGTGSKGVMSAGLGITNNSQDGLDVSPSIGFQQAKSDNIMLGLSLGTNYNSRMGIQNLQMTGQMSISNYDRKKLSGSGSAYLSFSKPSYTPRVTIPFTSNQFAFTLKSGGVAGGASITGYIRGYGSSQKIDDKDTTRSIAAFGYLYSEKANGNPDVLLDFNRENDIPYHEKTPNIAIPVHTYDTYSISGEGTGGMFRPYRNDLGYTYDHAMKSKSKSDAYSFEASFGTVFHGGVDLQKIDAVTANAPWIQNNGLTDIAKFSERDSSYENVYFKNPGEKTLVDRNYLDNIGDDQLIRMDLQPSDRENVPNVALSRTFTTFKNGYKFGKKTFATTALRKERDKRTQVISWMTAGQAAIAGLDKKIKSFPLNIFPGNNCNNFETFDRVDANRKDHHLSEITVLNGDGRRYIYGVPAYTLSNEEYTMSVKSTNGNVSNGLVSYTATDRSTKNDQGKENFFSQEKVPAYAHSFLISGILSPEYVDVTGDGITEDDLGDAVKFNYSRLHGKSLSDAYNWRVPFEQNKAAYNEGFKSESRDDKGSISYGSKEVWYLNSIESKTMVATFFLGDRQDTYSAINADGGKLSSRGLKRLDSINLYSKADYAKNGTAAKPIKKVVFKYNYSLCPGAPGSDVGGKLTLEKIYFIYNQNNKGEKNPYVFTYKNAGQNHQLKSVDRWGNVKNPSLNPGGSGDKMNNGDYPYSIQEGSPNYDKQVLDDASAAWTLNEIKLPSSGRIKVSYEQDDYAYVQNKRAMQFFELAGFGKDSSATPTPYLFPSKKANDDYQFVFVNVTEAVQSKPEILSKYLEGVKKVFFKVNVKMPSTDKWGKGYEMVPVYGDVLDYGVKAGSNGKTIWLRLQNIKNNESPLATAAVQFLRLNLPSKAYPFSEPGDQLTFKTLVQTLATVGDNVRDAIRGFAKHAREQNWCREIKSSHSFVRLNNPNYKKLGGGLRVKKVEIFDNWNKMTKQQMQESVYGQEYKYTMVTSIDGVDKEISSGVASYEPGVGADENPFKVPAAIYPENMSPLAPTNLMYSEEPFGETYFPGAVVGYSNVTVQTIHALQKSATGKEETQFYTSKDFPTLVEYTGLDNDSRKPYNPKWANIFKFNARNEITLSQGFKIELNDMHGKIKSQVSYAQNDSKNFISKTVNYYRLQKDQSLRPKLSNNVDVLDSANGSIKRNAEIGKDVEIMLDIREQVSATKSASIEVNFDWLWYFPPLSMGMVLAMPSSETNQYRSVAVMKIVNRYAILDSVIHVEKGSQVTTKNMLFDAESGEALLSQTNNEFDDPVYNFSYPAHWAYSGMGMAYKNTGTKFINVEFKDGKLYKRGGVDLVSVNRHFESGDEILFQGSTKRTSPSMDPCAADYHSYADPSQEIHKIWAIDAAKGKEKETGIFFIDKNGRPFSGRAESIIILRSGKRNLGSVSLGTVSSLINPIRMISGKERILFDTTSMVLNASAATYRDFWTIDSTLHRKDTVIMGEQVIALKSASFTLAYNGIYAINAKVFGGDRRFENEPAYPYFETMSYYKKSTFERDERGRRSWMLFDMNREVTKGSIVQQAWLKLPPSDNKHYYQRSQSNEIYISRMRGQWPRAVLGDRQRAEKSGLIRDFYEQTGIGAVDLSTRITGPATPFNIVSNTPFDATATSMVQSMVNDYWTSGLSPAITISLKNLPNDDNGKTNQQSYSKEPVVANESKYIPEFSILYIPGCSNGSTPTYSNGRYVCYNPVDSFVCRPIVDTMMNPYRWGILGNWRVDRAYSYYDRRKESDPLTSTDVRTNGQVINFKSFWNFTSKGLLAQADASIWVWNSESTKFNRKSLEIENHDPLDRYNAGQYGYNQSLPVAVGQNSKNREMVFEGFEDYDYQSDKCVKCNDYRFADFSSNNITQDKVHSGKYSLQINGNQSIIKTFPIVSVAQDTTVAALSLKLDSTAITQTTVNGVGTGLKMEYYDLDGECHKNQWIVISNNMNVNYSWYAGRPFGLCSESRYNDKFLAKLSGYIQPRFSGPYKFSFYADDDMRIYITRNGYRKKITTGRRIETTASTQFETSDTINMVAGELYEIYIEHNQQKAFYYSGYLQWESFGTPGQVKEIVPLSQFYHPTTNIANAKTASVSTQTSYCVKWRGARPTNISNPRFSPIRDRKMIVSAWVSKEGECIPEEFQNIEMRVGFNNGATWSGVMLPAGPLIDGWQRIESEITIPANATNMQIKMETVSSAVFYFDDIRLHPFNSNMKSFVYDKVNLRLMAELDENNYSTFYEYDDDGTLIRVKKETEKGIKTIKETRSALVKDPQ
jgi:hypothetical protein